MKFCCKNVHRLSRESRNGAIEDSTVAGKPRPAPRLIPPPPNYYPRAAVDRNAAIFELVRAIDHHIFSRKHFTMTSQTVQELSL